MGLLSTFLFFFCTWQFPPPNNCSTSSVVSTHKKEAFFLFILKHHYHVNFTRCTPDKNLPNETEEDGKSQHNKADCSERKRCPLRRLSQVHALVGIQVQPCSYKVRNKKQEIGIQQSVSQR